MKLSFSCWYPGSGVVLDCIDSCFFPLSHFFVFLKAILTKRSVSNDQSFLINNLTGQFRLTCAVQWCS